MDRIDLTIPKRIFVVPTSVIRDGVAYMGPEVKINANSARDAQERVKEHGHIPNPHFAPHEIDQRFQRSNIKEK